MTTKQCLEVLIQHLEKRRGKNKLAIIFAKIKNVCVIKYQASIRLIDKMIKIVEDAGENAYESPNPHDFVEVLEWIIEQVKRIPHDKETASGAEVFVFLEVMEKTRDEIFEMAVSL